MREQYPTRMLVMRPDQPHETVELKLPRAPGFDLLRKTLNPYLDGAHIEQVSVLADFNGGDKFKPLDMFVDEEGLLKHLPRNEAATIIYRRANQMGRSSAPKAADPEMLSFIVGTAVMFDRRVWF